MRTALLVSLLLTLLPLPGYACMTPNGVDDAQQIIDELSAGRHAALCPNTTWDLHKTVKFPWYTHDQQIYTDGWPHDNSRAVLSLNTQSTNCAVQANEGQPNVQLRNLIIDGYRGTCTTCNHPLVWFGGASATGQIVDACWLRYAHGWTHIVMEKGNPPGCTAGQITNNEIGPMGGQYIPGQHTDGISLQCRESTVFYNYIHNFDDGGIVIFGAPGSDVWGNDIRSSGAATGICMVDRSWETPEGYEDFTNTRVHNNTIRAIGRGGLIQIGIDMGQRLFNCDGYSVGGVVTNNSTVSDYYAAGFIYAYAIDGVIGWTVTGNTNSALTSSKPFLSHCATPPAGYPFRVHWQHVMSSVIQSDFVDGGPMHDPYT